MIQRSTIRREPPFYIESDGKPMGETPRHVRNLRYLVEPLEVWLAADAQAFVAGNMFVHYVPGNRNFHLSPDVFVVRGVPKQTDPERRAYLVWEEGKAPDLVIELTSATTREEDVTDKRALYQDILRVPEYFLFDPYEEYLHPRFQGYRLVEGQYQPIEPVDGRLPSEVLGLHLEPAGELLRLYDPSADRWLPIPPEVEEARKEAEQGWAAEAKARIQAEERQAAEAKARIQAEERQAAEAKARRQAEAERAAEREARMQAESEAERLRRELEQLRRRLSGAS